jgi:hypothetical protein
LSTYPPRDHSAFNDPSISTEEVQAELNVILRSRAFERSERLQKFLRYVCEAALRGERSRINEYLIGNEVFGRGADYSPNEDGIVRRQAHALRRKLQAYYENEGRESQIRIELPLGHYGPVFRRRASPVESETPPYTPGHKEEPRWTRRQILGYGLLFGAFMFVVGWVGARRIPVTDSLQASSKKFHPAIMELWGPWLNDSSGATICFSSPFTTVVKHFTKAVPLNSSPNRIRVSAGEERIMRQVFDLAPGGYLYMTPSLAQAKMGEAISAVHLAGLFSRANLPMRTTQSRFLSWETLRKENLILLGHNEANHYLDPILKKYPLGLAATDGDKPRRITNAVPAPGEPPEYHVAYSENPNDVTQEYALVSMIPSIAGRHRILLINGLNTQATQMATEFLTNPATAEELLARLRNGAPTHKGPWYFQIVLRAEVHDKVPTKGALVTLKIL